MTAPTWPGWTAEVIETLAALQAEGLSASQIGARDRAWETARLTPPSSCGRPRRGATGSPCPPPPSAPAAQPG